MTDAVRRMPDDEVRRLAFQWRKPGTCPFVDTDQWRCAVYDHRPTVCRLYGLTPGLECPHAPAVAATINPARARAMLDRDHRFGPIVGVLGMDIGWRELAGDRVALAVERVTA